MSLFVLRPSTHVCDYISYVRSSVKVYVAKELILQNMGANFMPTLQQSFAWPIPFNFASMGDPTWYNSKDH